MRVAEALEAYSEVHQDRVRHELERGFFERLVPRLLRASGGGGLLDLGCGDGLAARLAGDRLERYVGVDQRPVSVPGEGVAYDLRHGLGPVGRRPFDVYLGAFGIASHLAPAELRRLLGDVARHARPGSIVALEALGLRSLEWPRLWSTSPGAERNIPYRLGDRDVRVRPCALEEPAALYEEAGLRPLRAIDRSVQAGPKVGEGRYWPGLPAVRHALDALLGGSRDEADRALLRAALPPLPAGPQAQRHNALAERRRRLVGWAPASPAALARRIWALEPRSGGGYGHGLMMVGRAC